MKTISQLLLTWFLLIGGGLFILISPWITLRQHRLLELVEEDPFLAVQLDFQSLLPQILYLMILGVAAMHVGVHLRETRNLRF